MQTNRLGAAVALAFASTLPLAALAEAPRVTWRTPTSDAVISNTISGSACAVDATASVGMSRVTFWMGNYQINNDYSSPWNCTFDTRKLRDGTYQMRVEAVSSRGEMTRLTRNVTIRNSGTTTTPTNTAPTVSITSPTANQSITSSTLSFAANATDNAGVSRVEFRLDGSLVATDTSSPYGGSVARPAPGTHTLTATAYDAAGLSSQSSVTFTVPQSTTTPTSPTTSPLPAPTAGSLDVWFKAPLNGTTVSGTISGDKCYVKGIGVTKVDFLVDGQAVGSDTVVSDGMSCSIDTTKLANGSRQLTAKAYDANGGTRLDVISMNVQNTSTTPTTPTSPTPTEPAPTNPTPPATGTPSNLPNGGSAVATFQSLGLYWKPASNPGAAGCIVQYRKTTETSWKQGLNLWYDSRNQECRGSLVHLDPNTEYEAQFGVGSTFTHKVVAKTWSEQFPIAKTVTLPEGVVTSPLNIMAGQGGTADGYVLYQAHPNGTTIDVQNAHDQNILVQAPYVIIRGFKLVNGRGHGIRLRDGAHHVVIENNDISGWGRTRGTAGGKPVGSDMDSGIRAECSNSTYINTAMNTFVIQRNRIRNPRYTANSWTYGHPAGPQAVTLSYCGGNHVIRYNDMANTNGNKFNDAISGEDNFTQSGAPVSDSDIYGNLIVGAWDDGIEVEGSNRNVRVWSNYIDDTAIGIASTVTHHGPLYIWRNVYNRSRKLEGSPDSDDRGPFFKAGSGGSSAGDGRRYVFHNTSLQPSVGATNPGGAGIGIAGNTGQPLTNTVTRNNIFHIWKSGWGSVAQQSGGFGNDADYDLYNGTISANSGAEANGVKGIPTYVSGAGGASGVYQLAPGSLGHGRGAKIPNFNDGDSAPDFGAHQSGKPPMKFGVQ